MKDKKKDKDGEARARPKGSRKNTSGSDSQSLLNASAGTGFIGFSAFEASPKPSPAGYPHDTIGNARGGVKTTAVLGVRGRGKPDDGGFSDGQGKVLPPHYSGNDSSLAVISKRLSKRDSTTKVKALAELRAMCRQVTADEKRVELVKGESGERKERGVVSLGQVSTSAEALGGLAPHWVFLYQRLATEGDRRTREAASATLLCMLKANRKAFQPLMRSLMGPWWCLQADTAPEVSKSAKEAFENVFPESKRAAVLRRCAGGVLRHIDTALQQTPAVLEQALGCTPEEALKRSERLTVSALAAISSFMEDVGPETNEMLCRTGDAGEDVASKVHQDPRYTDQEATTYWSVVKERLWARLDDPRPAVRSAMYALVSSCCRHAAALLRAPTAPRITDQHAGGDGKGGKGTGDSNSDHGKRRAAGGRGGKGSRVEVPALLVGLLSENEASNHREAWQAVLLVLKEFKDTWRADRGGTMVLPTLLTRLRKGVFLPSSGSSYPCLLPFLASLSVEVLLVPTEKKSDGTGKPDAPFCAAFLDSLWIAIAKLAGNGACGWLCDVASAHLECVVFLLLKLPRSPERSSALKGGEGALIDGAGGEKALEGVMSKSPEIAASDGDDGPAAASLAAVTENLRHAWRSFVLSDDGSDGDAASDRGLLWRVGNTGRGAGVVREAFVSALGHLHSGEKRGAGTMGSVTGSAKVWGALLQECKGAVDMRCEDGVLWMGSVLVRALTRIKKRPAGGQRVGNDKGWDTRQPSSGKGGGGLPGLCRAVFQHCVAAIGFVDSLVDAKRNDSLAVVSPRDASLLSLMASISGVLGIDDASVPRREQALSSASSPTEDFYTNFLVPRLVASAGRERDTAGKKSLSKVTAALKELVEIHLRAGGSRRGEADFRVLLNHALGARPVSASLRAATVVLQMAPACPQRKSVVFTELEEAALAAFGLKSGARMIGSGSGSGSVIPPETIPRPDLLPAFLQACLGVKDGLRIAAPLIGAAATSSIVDASIAAEVFGGDLSCVIGVSAPGSTAIAANAEPLEPLDKSPLDRSTAIAALEGLLGVLVAAEKGALGATPQGRDLTSRNGDTDEEVGEKGDDAAVIACIRERGLSLVLGAFSVCGGESRAERRLWSDHGAPALAKLAVSCSAGTTSQTGMTAAPTATDRPRTKSVDIWEEFLEGAVEYTRGVMEGGGDRDRRDGVNVAGGGEGEKNAAMLVLALVKHERNVDSRGPVLPRSETHSGALASQQALESRVVTRGGSAEITTIPVLWRLGLTDPSVWRERRSEAFCRRGLGAAVSTVDLAQECVGSRWARRWETAAAVLEHLPDPRARLEFLAKGIPSAVGREDAKDGSRGSALALAGEVVQEILTAGVVVAKATQLVKRCGDSAAGILGKEDAMSDLPPSLSITSTAKENAGEVKVAKPDVRTVEVGYLEEFGVGLPSARGVGYAAGDGCAAEIAAAAAAAGVVDMASSFLGVRDGTSSMLPAMKAGPSTDDNTAAAVDVRHVFAFQEPVRGGPPRRPFDLLLPRDLWRTAFEASHHLGGKENPQPRTPEEDILQHDLLLAALSSAVGAIGREASMLGEGIGTTWTLWMMPCLAEVSTGLVVSVVGETFMLGLGLGEDANRLMAVRAGTLKLPVLTPEDLEPGVKTLYTREGQAVKVVAAHVDPGGDPYYTVRPVAAPGSPEPGGPERQTVMERLSLEPPVEAPHPQKGDASPVCPWVVQPRVAARLGEMLDGPVGVIERHLWVERGRSFSQSDHQELAARAAAASAVATAALRGCASTCLRAVLLSALSDKNGVGSDESQQWATIVPRVKALRNRWASAAVQSGSAVEAARGRGSNGGDINGEDCPWAVDAATAAGATAAAVALSTVVLSGFFSATPLMPSEEGGMRLLPARLHQALLEAGGYYYREGISDSALPAVACGIARDLASLAWLRDSAEALCKVHVSPSSGAVGGALFSDTQAHTEAALTALVNSTPWNRSDRNAGPCLDLALARACSALFAAEAARVEKGHGAALSTETKATLVSWAVSRFLLSGGRVASARESAHGKNSGDSDDERGHLAICLETARLLTAVAWDGRRGWVGEVGSGSASSRRLVAGARERVEIWKAARAPAVWRGLHAAVIGAVKSPTIQFCAFEVLEAAAAGWDCGAAPAALSGDSAKEEIFTDQGGATDEGKNAGSGGVGQSIVSRLATALGGWGVLPAAKQCEGAEDGGGPGTEGKDGEESAEDSTKAVTTVEEEEAKEQHHDLELVARCFPEDLLLAVEALPTTMDALAETYHASWNEEKGETRDIEITSEEDEEGEDEGELEEDEEEIGEGKEELMIIEAEEGSATIGKIEGSETETDDRSPEAEGGDGVGRLLKGIDVSDSIPQSNPKSRRKRLRRRQQQANPILSRGTRSTQASRGVNWTSRGRHGRHSPPSGPELTAPFLTWLLWLEHCQRASAVERKARSAARAFVVRAGALDPVLGACFRVLKVSQGDRSRNAAVTSRLGPAQGVQVSRLDPRQSKDLARLALAVYFRTVQVFPALSRSWWLDDCARGQRVWVAEFTRKHVSPALIQIEAQIIADATERGVWDEFGEMAVRASATSRQVVASYMKEECTLEASIQLPPEYPLRNVEVTCTKRMGISEKRWRQWVLQIVTLLSLQDGSVLDAVMLWKKNVDKEFEGVEPCVICYGILHPRDMALPQLTCKTCKNRFHSTCLYKWFHTSHKSRCPICQQPWA